MNLNSTRRRMLQLSAAFPALHFLRALDARAQGRTGKAAKRFILLYHPMGTSGSHWYGKGGSETNFELGYTLQPLAALKSDLVICRNVDNQPACEYWSGAPSYCRVRGGRVDQHSVATCTLLSPATPRNPNTAFTFPGMETLDWHIGRALRKPGVPHGHLYLTPAHKHGLGNDGVDVFSSRRNAGGQLEDPHAEDNPVITYSKYFGDMSPAPARDPAEDKAEADRRQRLSLGRRLVTDFVAKDVIAYQKALPTALRSELDAHIGELRELEKKLAAAPASTAAPDGSPEPEQLCEIDAPPATGLEHARRVSNYRARAEVTGDLAVAALACDITRSLTLSWFTFNGACYPPNLAGTKTYPNLHEGLQHNRHGYTRQSTADCHQHLAHQTARILSKLKAIPEGDGTMLDNTLVLWTSDMGMDPFDSGNAHNKTDLPFLLAGKAGGALRTGRLIDFQKMSHARLFSAILHLVGAPADSFGEAKYNQGGPAQQLLA